MTFTKETAAVAGKKGGKKTKKVHGLAHYSKLGKKGTKIQWKKKQTI